MEISIKTLKGKNINLEVEDSSNTIDVKIHGEPMRELVVRLGPSGWGAAVMRIFVVTLTGNTRTVEVTGSDTIGEVKTKWQEMEGIPVDQQRLVFQGRQLEDSRTVAECHIKHGSTMHMIYRLCCC
ncbi:ubiquitin-like [Brassica rapa]|uniref:ubiquitin-like n=1 Tax=Brassica campestris TaxID=3711 RepID=UPI00142E5591|nr:ubiquitin-like [Brassica rapa]